MTDDLKQKAHAAWENVGRNDIRAAVSASIAAALAEALDPVWEEQLLHVKALDGLTERVARLEYRSTATATGVLPDGERVQCTECSGTTNSPSQFAWTCLDGRWRCETHSKPPAPCPTCGAARFVCDSGKASWGKSWPCMTPAHVEHDNRRLCPACSKPAASPEGETACTRHGQYRCPACAESKGNGQWRAGRSIGRTLYIGDKCIGMVDTPELAAAIVAAMNAPSPAESEGKPDWADWMATNEYHLSLGAKWMCEAIAREYAPDEREFVHAFARKWEDASFWRPKTSVSDGKPRPFPVQARTPDRATAEAGERSPDNTAVTSTDSKAVARQPGETGAISPAATQGIPQSVPQAPEPPFDTTWLYWCPTYSGVHHIDTHAGFHNGTRMHAVKVVRHDLLVSAERRIAELEGETLMAMLDKARAEGREAGIRVAIRWLRERAWNEAANMLSGHLATGELLAKKPEVGT